MKSSPPTPDTLETPVPTAAAPSTPPASSPVEKRPMLSADRAAALHKAQWRRGFSALGTNRRNTPIVRLREHQTHGRGS